MAYEASQEFINKFVERQQKAISDLMNKTILLETQLAVAMDRVALLEANQKEQVKTESFESSEVKAQ